MITLTQHLPNWLDGFDRQIWKFDSLESLKQMPFIKNVISECGKRCYDKFTFLIRGNMIFMSFADHMSDGEDINDYVVPIGKVDNIEEAKKLFNA